MTELQRLRDEGWRADGERDEVRLVRGGDDHEGGEVMGFIILMVFLYFVFSALTEPPKRGKRW